MSADNGIYILRTPIENGYEYRVSYMSAIDNLSWDDERGCSTDDKEVLIKNARKMWSRAKVFTVRGEALEAAHDLADAEYTEYGVVSINLDTSFTPA